MHRGKRVAVAETLLWHAWTVIVYAPPQYGESGQVENQIPYKAKQSWLLDSRFRPRAFFQAPQNFHYMAIT